MIHIEPSAECDMRDDSCEMTKKKFNKKFSNL